MSDRVSPPPGLRPLADASVELRAREVEPLDADPDDAGDVVGQVRDRLSIDDAVPDVTIAASIAQIATRGDARARWLAAFGSPLGKHLAGRGDDLNAALDVLLALSPRHQS